MTKRHLLQVDIGEQLEREIEQVAREMDFSKSDAARDLLRRGLTDFRQEQEFLRERRSVNAMEKHEAA